MARKSPPSPDRNAASSREDRLKAALKANLARRKKQAKARTQSRDEENGEPGVTEKD